MIKRCIHRIYVHIYTWYYKNTLSNMTITNTNEFLYDSIARD